MLAAQIRPLLCFVKNLGRFLLDFSVAKSATRCHIGHSGVIKNESKCELSKNPGSGNTPKSIHGPLLR
jgi:hypothetical protein